MTHEQEACPEDEDDCTDATCEWGAGCGFAPTQGCATGACDPNPCLNGGTCTEVNGQPDCDCPAPYIGDLCTNGGACVTDSDCAGQCPAGSKSCVCINQSFLSSCASGCATDADCPDAGGPFGYSCNGTYCVLAP